MKIEEKTDYLEIHIKNKIYKIDHEFKLLFVYFSWYIGHYGYLTTKNNNKIIRFHRMISNCPEGMVVDHINRDVTDNRKINLRNVTPQQNSRNRTNITGKYKGVSWSKHCKKWRATITDNGKQVHLGYYDCEHLAAKAYNKYIEDILNGDGFINKIVY